VRDLTGRPARTFEQFLTANSQALHAAFAPGRTSDGADR